MYSNYILEIFKKKIKNDECFKFSDLMYFDTIFSHEGLSESGENTIFLILNEFLKSKGFSQSYIFSIPEECYIYFINKIYQGFLNEALKHKGILKDYYIKDAQNSFEKILEYFSFAALNKVSPDEIDKALEFVSIPRGGCKSC